MADVGKLIEDPKKTRKQMYVLCDCDFKMCKNCMYPKFLHVLRNFLVFTKMYPKKRLQFFPVFTN